MRAYPRILLTLLTAFVFLNGGAVNAQGLPTPEYIFKTFRPGVTGVDYDTPLAADFAKCKVEVERSEGQAGFVVYDPTGQVLRRFTDVNGDSKPDLFRYYKLGLEVYRGIDNNKDGRADEHRWMNWGGMRWGVDRDQDGKIEEWKILSAQEAARIAVESMIAGDAVGLSSVMLSAADVKAIRTSAVVSKKLMESVANPAAQLRKTLSSSQTINAKTQWVRFDPPDPGLIPKEAGKAEIDLVVYENAMGIVRNGEAHELVAIGEMIRIGNTWKLTQVPAPLSDNTQVQIGGILMQPELLAGGLNAPPEMAKEMEDLLTQLEKLDSNSPSGNVTPTVLARYHQQRADVIEKIIRFVPTANEKVQWIQQFADGVAAAVQTGHYDDGLKRLVALQEQVKADNDLLGYVSYRRLMAEYAVRLKPDDEDSRQKGQEWWLKQLEVYATQWPGSPDAADAIVQLAISHELMGRVDDAKRWYTVLTTKHGGTNAGKRAAGALRRLDLAGKPLVLSGTSLTGQQVSAAQYRGKVTLVVFWATWSQPYVESLPKLLAVYQKYQRNGFEVLGVNLDADPSGLQAFMTKNGGNKWQHLRDPNGTEGKLSSDFGIITVPTMFLVDKTGRVASGVSADNLDAAVQLLLQGRSLPATRGSAAGGAGERK